MRVKEKNGIVSLGLEENREERRTFETLDVVVRYLSSTLKMEAVSRDTGYVARESFL
jgi:hypothetical protein